MIQNFFHRVDIYIHTYAHINIYMYASSSGAVVLNVTCLDNFETDIFIYLSPATTEGSGLRMQDA